MSISKKIRTTMMLPVVAAMMLFAPYYAQAAQTTTVASTTVSQSGELTVDVGGGVQAMAHTQAMSVGDQVTVSPDNAMALSTETMSGYVCQMVVSIDDNQAMASVVLIDQADTTVCINHVGASGSAVTSGGLTMSAGDGLGLSRTTSLTG